MTIWKSELSLEQANRRGSTGAARHLGIEITEVGDDFLKGRMPVDHRTQQPMGVLHGGASILFAETLGSIGASYAAGIETFSCFGQEINGNHIRSVSSGWVHGTARPVHIGRTSQVWSIEITDEAGRMVCISRLTIACLPRPAGLKSELPGEAG